MQLRWRSFNQLCGSCYAVIKHTLRIDLRNSRSSTFLNTRYLGRPLSTTSTGQQELSIRQRRKDILPTPDTIYALSSAPGRAAIAIIRVSGPACLDIYGGLCPDRAFPHPRYATLRRLVDPEDSSRVLDTGALILYFPAPKTVTGEPVLEFHVHGGPAVVRSVLEAIPKCINTRPRRRTAEYSHIRAAEPGEFTKRAFYNGRLDLTQAEALGETLAAETEQQHRLAIAGADGGLAARYEGWRKMLLYARGELEALIDFSEDQHFDESPTEFMASVSRQVMDLRREIEIHIKNASRGEMLRSGINVALLGAPNAGKSSLLNRIVGREAAIVSSEAGTTRDIVDVSIDIGGWLVRLGDMAGLRRGLSSSSNEGVNDVGTIEQEGIRRAKERAMQSDLVIALLSVDGSKGSPEVIIEPEIFDAVQSCYAAGKTVVFVVNKIDLVAADNRSNLERRVRRLIEDTFPIAKHSSVFFLSCKEAAYGSSTATNTDHGAIQSLLQGLTSAFSSMTNAITVDYSLSLTPQEAQSYWTTSLSVTHRQSTYLRQCLAHLDDFLAQNMLPSVDALISNNTGRTETKLSHHIDGHDDLVGEIGPHVLFPVSHVHGPLQGHGIASTLTDDLRAEPHGRVTDGEADFDIVTAAEHLRYAAACLAKITGRGEGGDVEDVLGVVFEK